MSSRFANPSSGGAWSRLGFEVELLAPQDASRATLATQLAERSGGTSRPIFHHDTEPSLVKDRPVFHHLSRGFEVLGDSGHIACRLVDDVTIQNDLDHAALPTAGWYRVLSDEPRLLRLIQQLADPTADAEQVLKPVAAAFGVAVESLPSGRFRLDDAAGSTVAIVAPQGGDRQRVCEVITPPLDSDHHAALAALLEPAEALGFTIPSEAAVHVHLDADPFRSSTALIRLVRMFSADRDELWRAVDTNPRCRRLGPLPTELVEGVEQPGFDRWPWDRTAAWLQSLPLTKYSDCNLTNLAAKSPLVDTVEMRILPGAIDAAAIMAGVSELQRRYIEQ